MGDLDAKVEARNKEESDEEKRGIWKRNETGKMLLLKETQNKTYLCVFSGA